MVVITLLFVVPAALGVLAFWSIWRLVGLFNLSLSARRTLFVLLGTFTLAPMLIPIATIMTAWVPHGMLILMMPTELFGYYIQVARYVFPSFVVTALFFGLIAMRWVRADTARPLPNWVTFLVPVFVVLLIVATYRYAFPSNEIPPRISHETIEVVYGQRLDEVVALLDIADGDERDSAVTQLQDLFQLDTSVLEVNLQVKTGGADSNPVYDQIFYYQRREGKKGSSGYRRANVTEEQRHLHRYTWRYKEKGAYFVQCAKQWFSFVRKCDQRDVLQYLRRFTHHQEPLSVLIAFDYEEVLQAVDH